MMFIMILCKSDEYTALISILAEHIWEVHSVAARWSISVSASQNVGVPHGNDPVASKIKSIIHPEQPPQYVFRFPTSQIPFQTPLRSVFDFYTTGHIAGVNTHQVVRSNL